MLGGHERHRSFQADGSDRDVAEMYLSHTGGDVQAALELFQGATNSGPQRDSQHDDAQTSAAGTDLHNDQVASTDTSSSISSSRDMGTSHGRDKLLQALLTKLHHTASIMRKLGSEESQKYIIHPRPELNRASALVLEPSSIQDERTRCVWYDSRGWAPRGFRSDTGSRRSVTAYVLWPGNRAQPVASIYGLSRYQSTPLWLKIFWNSPAHAQKKTKSKTFEVRGVDRMQLTLAKVF